MYVTFWNPDNPATFEDREDPLYGDRYQIHTGGGLEVRMDKESAMEILHLLGMPSGKGYGKVPASALEALCRRAIIRLGNLPGMDDEIPVKVIGNIITPGRKEGYLSEHINLLLRLTRERITEEDEILWG
jgi:hypothetical protein